MSEANHKVILTPEEAESLLPDGDTVHNFANPAGMLVGCDYERSSVITAFKSAVAIEIGGPSCKAMGHPIVVWSSDKSHTFFEADMTKVEALEIARAEGRHEPA